VRAETAAPPSHDELRRLLHSSARLDQVRAIALLVQEGTPEATRVLLDAYLASDDRILSALLQEALLDPSLDVGTTAVDVCANGDARVIAKLAGVLARVARERPGLTSEVVDLLVGAIDQQTPEASAIPRALVELGEPALVALGQRLADPRMTP